MRWNNVILLAPLMVACAGSGAAMPGQQELRGTVHHLDLEGGVFVIDVNDTLRYQPLNLPKEMAKDGLKVRFSFRPREAMMGTAQVGRIVDLVTVVADSVR